MRPPCRLHLGMRFSQAEIRGHCRTFPNRTSDMEIDEERVSFWLQHVESWKKSELTRRAYCTAHGLPRRSFVRWRVRFKEDDAIAERRLRWRHLPKRRPSDNPSANPMPMAPVRPPFGVPRPNRRRCFPEELKRQIVEETLQAGATASSVARLCGVLRHTSFAGASSWSSPLRPKKRRLHRCGSVRNTTFQAACRPSNPTLSSPCLRPQ